MIENTNISHKGIFKRHIVMLIFFCIMLLLLALNTLWEGSDDTAFRAQLETMSITEWIWMRATTWQARLVNDFLFAIFQFNMPVWKISTAAITTLLIFTICNFPTNKSHFQLANSYEHVLACSSFFMMLPHVISASLVWYTGSFFYVWPTCFLLIAMLPFYRIAIGRPMTNKWGIALAVLCSALTGYQEQCGAIFVCFAVFTFLIVWIHKERVPGYLFLQFAFVCINVVIYMSLAGVELRNQAAVYYYKDFPMLSFTEKLFQAINWGNYQLFNASNALLFLLCGTVFLLLFYQYNSPLVRCLAGIPLAFSGLSIIPFGSLFSRLSKVDVYTVGEYRFGESLEKAIEWLMNPMTARPSNFVLGGIGLLPGFLGFTILLYVGVLICIGFSERRAGITNMILYFAALSSSYVNVFSATIFASSNRIFFVTNVLLILIVVLIFREIQNHVDLLAKKWFRIGMAVTAAAACCFYLEQFVFFLNGNAHRY